MSRSRGRRARSGRRRRRTAPAPGRRVRRRPTAAGPTPGPSAGSGPVAVTCCHCSSGAAESCCGRSEVSANRVGSQRRLDLAVLPIGLGVLAQLPGRQHGEAQVGERDDHQRQGQPARPQQERQALHLSGQPFAGEALVHPDVQSRQCGLDDGERRLRSRRGRRSTGPRRRGTCAPERGSNDRSIRSRAAVDAEVRAGSARGCGRAPPPDRRPDGRRPPGPHGARSDSRAGAARVGTLVGAVAGMPVTGSRAASPGPPGQAALADLVGEHLLRHRGAADVARADEGDVQQL